MFKPDENLRRALGSKDPIRIKTSLLNYIRKDPGDNKALILPAFERTLRLYPELLEEHRDFEDQYFCDPTKWNEHYFSLILVRLMDNFSRERFLHLVQVGRFLYGVDNDPEDRMPQGKKPVRTTISFEEIQQAAEREHRHQSKQDDSFWAAFLRLLERLFG